MKNLNTKFIKRDLIITLSGLVIMSLFIFFTNPFSMPIWVILLVPIVASIVTANIFKILLKLFLQDIKGKSLTVLSLSSALFVLIMFLLGSLKQLGIQDFALVLAFISGSAFYFYKAEPSLTITE